MDHPHRLARYNEIIVTDPDLFPLKVIGMNLRVKPLKKSAAVLCSPRLDAFCLGCPAPAGLVHYLPGLFGGHGRLDVSLQGVQLLHCLRQPFSGTSQDGRSFPEHLLLENLLRRALGVDHHAIHVFEI